MSPLRLPTFGGFILSKKIETYKLMSGLPLFCYCFVPEIGSFVLTKKCAEDKIMAT